jgi:hypothetical protein
MVDVRLHVGLADACSVAAAGLIPACVHFEKKRNPTRMPQVKRDRLLRVVFFVIVMYLAQFLNENIDEILHLIGRVRAPACLEH